MAFDAVVFGTHIIGTGFTVGDSISTGGFRCFIVPQATVGDAPFDVTITYVDQFGNSQTADVSTSVEAYETSGTHIEIALNAGDTGIRSISAVTVVGGTAGDEFTLESWNEGLGSALDICSSDENQPEFTEKTLGVREYSQHTLVENESYNSLIFTQDVVTSNVTYNGSNFVLETEQIDIYPENSAHVDTDDGFLPGLFTLDNYTMSMKLDLASEDDYNKVDADYMSKGFEIIASGFTKITFDYDVILDASHFIAELMDSEGNVKWSKNGSASGTGQVVTFVDDYCLFRVRCITPDSPAVWTSPVDPWDNHMYIGNVVLDRYKTSGYIEQTSYKYREFMKELRLLQIGGSEDTDTQIKAQIDCGDSLASTIGFVGPTGADSYYLIGSMNNIYTGGYAGKYWRTKIWLTGDGKYTPTFDWLKYTFDIWHKLEKLNLEISEQPASTVPVDFHQLVLCSSDDNQPFTNFKGVSGSEMVGKFIDLEHTKEAWNEFYVNKTGQIGLNTHRLLYDLFEASDFIYACLTSGVVYNNNTWILTPEEVEPDYSTEIDDDDGFLSCVSNIDVGNKELSIILPAETVFNVIDSNYENHSFIWEESGFTSIEFDYDVSINSIYFILELVDADGTVKWSKNGTASGTGQVVSMTTTRWQFRLRCKANYTSPAEWSNYIKVSNIKMTRYPLTGYIEMPWYLYRKHTISMDMFEMSTTDATGCDLKAQVLIGDGETDTGWIGPDGTSSSFYRDGYTPIDTNGYAGTYYKLKILFESDGRYTPTFHFIRILQYVEMYLRHLPLKTSWSESTVGVVMSGYVRDQNNDIITDAVKVILESTYVFGRDTMGTVNPETGFYQVFVKDAKYDKRHLIREVSGKTTNLSLKGYSTPDIVDATSGDVPNQDLQFWKAPLCKSVAHVDSLVTY